MQNTEHKNSRLFNACFISASLFLSFIFIIYITTTLTFIAGGSVHPAHFIISMLLATGISWFLCKKILAPEKRLKHFIIHNVVFWLVSFALFYVSGAFYDTSHDGQWYHQEAVIKLKQGWNPFHERVTPYYKFESIPWKSGPDFFRLNGYSNWARKMNYVFVNHYTLGPALIRAAAYVFFNNIETAKGFNFLFIIIVFLYTSCALLEYGKLKLPIVAVVAFLAAFNPINIYQGASFYIDNFLGSLLLSIMTLVYVGYKREEMRKFISPLIVLILAFLINVKFTALAFVAVWGLGLLILSIIHQKKGEAVLLLKIGLIAVILGLIVFGYGTYVKNTVKYGHPFYPIYTSYSSGPSPGFFTMPPKFSRRSRFEKFFISLYSRSRLVLTDYHRLKTPFTIHRSEYAAFTDTYTDIGGFGPLFSGVFTVTLLLLLYKSAVNEPQSRILLQIAVLLLISVFIIPECWLARYVPQLFTIPLLVLTLSASSRHTWQKAVAWLMLLALIVNAVYVAVPYVKTQASLNRLIDSEMKKMAKWPQPVIVDFTWFPSNRLILKRYEIEYKEVEDIESVRHFQTLRGLKVTTKRLYEQGKEGETDPLKPAIPGYN